MEPRQEAFFRIKDDISLLKEAIFELKNELEALKEQVNTEFCAKNMNFSQDYYPTHPEKTPTHTQQYPLTPTHFPTLPQETGGLRSPKNTFSTGNRGVPTVNPTDKPTHQQTNIYEGNLSENHFLAPSDTPIKHLSKPLSLDFERASELLASLDSLKREIRLKFKQITEQEMVVFSTLYSMEEAYFASSPLSSEAPEISYKTLAKTLNLSESSIRDYVNRLIFKGIPIIKTKKNNKKIYLSISPELKKMASLSTIIKLREL